MWAQWSIPLKCGLPMKLSIHFGGAFFRETTWLLALSRRLVFFLEKLIELVRLNNFFIQKITFVDLNCLYY